VPDEAAPSGVGGVLALCTETTLSVLARHESDRRLSEVEARFREIANAAPVMIWVADEAQACRWFNTPWLRFTGRTLEQALGSGWVESIHPDDVGRCLETYAEAFESRRPFRMDFRLRRHDGEWRVVDNTGAPRLGEDGVLLGFIGSCIDVTRQRETEARFRGVFNATPAPTSTRGAGAAPTSTCQSTRRVTPRRSRKPASGAGGTRSRR
jgi:PAS domain S-box-containing protein